MKENNKVEQKSVTLYLAGWPKRMAADYVKGLSAEKVNKIMISIIDKKYWVMYRVPVWESAKNGEWVLYLTDEQISHVSEALGIKTKISAFNISPEMLKAGTVAFK
jgi:hypothetical protein